MKKSNFSSLLFILLILFIFIFLIYLYKNEYIPIEHFVPYTYGPYNYMTTGVDPLTFYPYPIYRKPYMYPYQFYQSYPSPHMTYYETNI
jgi:hypothetical protein